MTLDEDMQLAESLLSYVVARVLETRRTELQICERDTTALERVKAPFPRITYAEAIKILQENGHPEAKVGDDFGGDEEDRDFEGKFDRPVIVHRYPDVDLKRLYFAKDPERPELALAAWTMLAPEGYRRNHRRRAAQKHEPVAARSQRSRRTKLPARCVRSGTSTCAGTELPARRLRARRRANRRLDLRATPTCAKRSHSRACSIDSHHDPSAFRWWFLRTSRGAVFVVGVGFWQPLLACARGSEIKSQSTRRSTGPSRVTRRSTRQRCSRIPRAELTGPSRRGAHTDARSSVGHVTALKIAGRRPQGAGDRRTIAPTKRGRATPSPTRAPENAAVKAFFDEERGAHHREGRGFGQRRRLKPCQCEADLGGPVSWSAQRRHRQAARKAPRGTAATPICSSTETTRGDRPRRTPPRSRNSPTKSRLRATSFHVAIPVERDDVARLVERAARRARDTRKGAPPTHTGLPPIRKGADRSRKEGPAGAASFSDEQEQSRYRRRGLRGAARARRKSTKTIAALPEREYKARLGELRRGSTRFRRRPLRLPPRIESPSPAGRADNRAARASATTVRGAH